MAKKRHYKDALSRNRNTEEIAEDLGLSTGERRDKEQRETYQVCNAGQGQVKVRGKNQNKQQDGDGHLFFAIDWIKVLILGFGSKKVLKILKITPEGIYIDA